MISFDAVPVLSRVQQNEIHEIVVAAGLNPIDFSWQTKVEQHFGTVTQTITHTPTDAHFSFSIISDGEFYLSWWPMFSSGRTNLSARSWQGQVLPVVASWVDEVKDNHEAPDLWAEAAKARYVTDAASDFGADNTPFTPAEIESLKPRLDEVEAYIESRQPLDEQQKRIVQSRFRYLLGAAKRGIGRIDWLNVFVSQVVELVVEGVMKSSLYGDVMRYAGTALSRVIMQLGARFLGP